LVNADAEMVGEDVEVTSVESHMEIGHAVVGNGDYLITRRASRGVVAEALRLPPEATRAIVGTEGIGKSWTLIFALQLLNYSHAGGSIGGNDDEWVTVARRPRGAKGKSAGSEGRGTAVTQISLRRSK
jgi:ABC-type glutathione transport system ATPase component